MKNFYVPNSPQTAYSFSLDYRSPKFWSATVTFNYFDRTYLDFSPFRRTADAVFGLEKGSDIYNSITHQQKAPDSYTVDLFANKSFKVNDDALLLPHRRHHEPPQFGGHHRRLRAVALRAGRLPERHRRFPPKYFYAFGTNFFVMGALRF